ncbi:MAG: chorismate mutase [Pseudomonadota bacterium]
MDEAPKTLNNLRLKIADIDSEILSLVKQRLDLCRDMTPLKIENKVPLRDSDQEQIVLERSASWAQLQGEDQTRAQAFTRLLMEWGLYVQKM